MQKIRYEVDPHNRLVVVGSGDKDGPPKFRKVLDGRFKLDADNNLSYIVKAPLSGDETIPHQIRLRGEWSLTDDHDLRLTLNKEGRATFGDEVTLEGEILGARGDSLLFAVTTRSRGGKAATYVLNLAGVWRANDDNRLSFHVRKERGKYDILVFNAAWEMGQDHEIVYQYEKADLAKKKKNVHSIVFKGWWEIRAPLCISYLLSAGTDSVFDFRTSAGLFKEGRIEYELGIGVSGRRMPARRTIVLFGRWKLKKDTGLVFEIEYEDKKKNAMVFGADAKLTGRDTVSFRLRSNVENREIGATLELSHEMLGRGGEVLLRGLASNRELAVYAGAAWSW